MPGVLWQRGGDSGCHMVAQEHRATFSQQPQEVPGSHILNLLFCKNLSSSFPFTEKKKKKKSRWEKIKLYTEFRCRSVFHGRF